MAPKKILITSGPTREYLDPVRYLTNGSSGRMGAAFAQAALEKGMEVTIISGPVQVDYPAGARVLPVITTEEMLQAALQEFPKADVTIGAAAPSDFKPILPSVKKLTKADLTQHGEIPVLTMEFIETPDILAALGKMKREDQILVAFALETDHFYEHAYEKMKRKNADYMILNRPTAIASERTTIEILKDSKTLAIVEGSKAQAAREILSLFDKED